MSEIKWWSRVITESRETDLLSAVVTKARKIWAAECTNTDFNPKYEANIHEHVTY